MKNTIFLLILISSLFVSGCSQQKPVSFSVQKIEGFELGKVTIKPYVGVLDYYKYEAVIDIKNISGKTVKISHVKAHALDENGSVIGSFEGEVYGEKNNNDTFVPTDFATREDIDLSRIKSVKLVIELDSEFKAASENNSSNNANTNWNGEIKTGYFSAKSSNDALYFRLYFQDDAQNKGMVLSITDLLKGETTKLLLEYLSKSDGSGTRDFSCKATEATTLKERNLTMTYLATNDAFKVTSGYGVDDLFKNLEFRRE